MILASEEKEMAHQLIEMGFACQDPEPGHGRRVGSFAIRDGIIAAYLPNGRYWRNANFIFFRKTRVDFIRARLENMGLHWGGKYAY